jgi:uncharacterized protein (TIGR02217 family)
MSNQFTESRLEIGINYGASYGPRFRTLVNQQSDGIEQRQIKWFDPLILCNLAEFPINITELNYLLSFHSSVKGSLIGFRLKDWSDYQASGYTLGTGTGVTQTWQLTKTYRIENNSVTRLISKPVPNSVVLRKDGVIQSLGWSIDTTTGIITTTLTGSLSVDSFEFDIPVRFEQDKINFTFLAGTGQKIFTLGALTCAEIRLKSQSLGNDVIPASLPQINLGYDYGTIGGPRFETKIASSGSEFEDRKAYWKNPLRDWNIGSRTLSKSEVDYFISFFRNARGMGIPFSFYDQQDGTPKRVRFAEDVLRLRFDAYQSNNKDVIFNLGGIGVKELLPASPGISYFRIRLIGVGVNENDQAVYSNSGTPMVYSDWAWGVTDSYYGYPIKRLSGESGLSYEFRGPIAPTSVGFRYRNIPLWVPDQGTNGGLWIPAWAARDYSPRDYGASDFWIKYREIYFVGNSTVLTAYITGATASVLFEETKKNSNGQTVVYHEGVDYTTEYFTDRIVFTVIDRPLYPWVMPDMTYLVPQLVFASDETLRKDNIFWKGRFGV